MTMRNRLQFCQILLVLMVPVIVTQETVVQNRFQKLDPGQSAMGKIEAQQKAGSHQEYALRQVSITVGQISDH